MVIHKFRNGWCSNHWHSEDKAAKANYDNNNVFEKVVKPMVWAALGLETSTDKCFSNCFVEQCVKTFVFAGLAWSRVVGRDAGVLRNTIEKN